LQETPIKKLWFAVIAGVQTDALTRNLNFVAPLMENKMVEESALSRSGRNLHRNSIDMIRYLKVNAQMHIVGSLTMQRVLMLAWMQIIKFNFVETKNTKFVILYIFIYLHFLFLYNYLNKNSKKNIQRKCYFK
jgi:FlaA1/EpsC-like NDP-sugar epimerase